MNIHGVALFLPVAFGIQTPDDEIFRLHKRGILLLMYPQFEYVSRFSEDSAPLRIHRMLDPVPSRIGARTKTDGLFADASNNKIIVNSEVVLMRISQVFVESANTKKLDRRSLVFSAFELREVSITYQCVILLCRTRI